MEATPRRVVAYRMAGGRRPFWDWLLRIKDRAARAKILARLERVEAGNFGDHEPAGRVMELRVNYGPGYRVYYGLDEGLVVVLLCGGDKGTQSRDIRTAEKYWQDYQERGS